MGNLVTLENGYVYTTSNLVGEEFGIMHKHILEKIESLDIGKLVEYTNSRNRKYRSYNLTLQEALVLIMNLSNKEAIFFKTCFFSLLCEGLSIEECYEKSISKIRDKDFTQIEAITYIIQDYDTKKFKIGKTIRDIEKRLCDLQRSSSTLLEIHSVITKDIEKELHKRFAGKRLVSEWFNISEEDIYLIHKDNRANFIPYSTLDSLLYELSHQLSGNKEFTVKDIIDKQLTANELIIVKNIIEREMENGEHYKVIFEKCKTSLENFANGLMIKKLN